MNADDLMQAAPETLAARIACEEVFLKFHRLIDEGSASEAIDLFTSDAVFEVRGQRFEGRRAILDFLQRRERQADRRTRHLASNFTFALTSPTSAEGSAQLLIVAGSGAETKQLDIEAVSDCVLRFRRTPPGIWQMTARSHRRFATANSDQASKRN
jgi:hypothetical protein